MQSRPTPLVLIATPNEELADKLTLEVRRNEWIACRARDYSGCLRVATAVAPDVVLIDRSLPRKLRAMLHSHPATAHAVIVPIAAGEALPRMGASGVNPRRSRVAAIAPG